MWRLPILPVLSQGPRTFLDNGTLESGAFEIYQADPFSAPALLHLSCLGARMLLASLLASELAELVSLYDWIWRETIQKVYPHKSDPYTSSYCEDFQVRAEHRAREASR